MYKNVASQKLDLYAYDYTTGAPKTGDAANILAYVAKDDGTLTVVAGAAAEIDATNGKGWYRFALTQAETNGNKLLFTGKSTTANVTVQGRPVYTDPNNYSSHFFAPVKGGTTAGAGSNYIDFAAATITTADCPVGGSIFIDTGTGVNQWLPSIASVVSGGGYVTRAYGPSLWSWPVTVPGTATSTFQIFAAPGYVLSPISGVWDDTANPTRALTAAGNAAVMTQQMTEAYAALGAAPTPAQALMLLMQMLTSARVSGTQMQVYDLAGTTPVRIFVLSAAYPAELPTSITPSS